MRNYLGTVTKARIVEAVREGAGERPAQLIEHLKKGDMAKEAERLLADSGWLPEPLRLAATDEAPVETGAENPAAETHDGAEPDADALPAFLSDVGDETMEGDDPAANEADDFAHAVAAE